ncbi:hypothetical protein [Paraburkholderia youngii]|uniref:Uncharacterized protein n=1 Tax=Paraburkholderia youngii TaxID=2782701 RepID=A0A7W8P396_9BURK|nr:hypothetical protein [Paraburkholderia youngii]MBB5399973.1 hypothetical protein [Paraburkholderia youngii]
MNFFVKRMTVSMKMNHKASLFIAAIFLSAGSAGAQSLATGESRQVSEPAYPGVCQTRLRAERRA